MSEYLRTVFDKFELRVRKGFHYTRDDLWVTVENGKVKVGVSDYLQKTSGDVAFMEIDRDMVRSLKGSRFGQTET